MQKAGQKSQSKSVLGYPRIYALAEKGVNAAYVRVAFWAVGAGDFNASFRVTFRRAEIPAKIAEIDAALAEGSGIFDAGDGKVYEISTELLGELRSILSSYHAVLQGGSDAQVVRGGVSTSAKPKASARQGNGSAARQNLISQKDTCADSDAELDDTAHTAQVSADFENQVARIVGEELRKAVMPLLAEIDAIAALLKECALEVAAFKPVRERNAGKSSTDGKMPISTRRGRTSLVVGSRKVS